MFKFKNENTRALSEISRKLTTKRPERRNRRIFFIFRILASKTIPKLLLENVIEIAQELFCIHFFKNKIFVMIIVLINNLENHSTQPKIIKKALPKRVTETMFGFFSMSSFYIK